MSKKQNNTVLYLALAAAAVYVAKQYYDKRLLQTSGSFAAPLAGAPVLQNPAGIAIERPSFNDIGIVAPKLDPTGMQITFY